MSEPTPTAETPEAAETPRSAFVPLHLHTEYSALDGGCKIKNIPAKLRSLGMDACAITDHGLMQGVPIFYETLKKEGIRAILGIEIYLTDDRFNHHKDSRTYHLTLIARTSEGYRNLCRISSFSFIEGYYRKPRADWALLEQYSEGIICLTGCMAAPAMNALFEGNLTKARTAVERLVSIFGVENVYGEIQNVGIVEQIPAGSELAAKLGKTDLSQNEANRELAEICAPLGVRLVATGDTHYLSEEDADPHDAMVCIGTKQHKNGKRKFSLLPKKYYLRSEAEMRELLAEWPEAIAESSRIAARCEAEIEFDQDLLPRYPIPEGFAGRVAPSGREMSEADAYLHHLCVEGIEKRYGDVDEAKRAEVEERLEFELATIAKMGYSDYFLIIWDLQCEAIRRGIPSGPGRGCLVPDTPVWDGEAWTAIGEVAAGAEVITHRGTYRSVSGVHVHDVDETLTTITVGRHTLTLTGDHRVFTSQQVITCDRGEHDHDHLMWVHAEEVAAGDLLVFPVGSPLPEGLEVESDEHYHYATVVEVGTIDYAGPVCDLSVEPEQSFLTPAGVVHNSAAGSIVAYALEITQLDPLEYGLLFERFLNPDRISMPDIDWDVSQERRDEMVQYAMERYCSIAEVPTAVAMTATFMKLGAKAALKDAARVLTPVPAPGEHPTHDAQQEAQQMGNKLAKFVGDKPGTTLQMAWDESSEMRTLYAASPLARQVVDLARWLEGFVRGDGIHAAAVNICDKPLEDYLPLQQKGPKDNRGPLVTQYDMKYCEKLGLLKMDFLGLRNLDIIAKALELIKETEGVDMHPYRIPVDDEKTYEMLRHGDAVGVFQFESGGMQGALREIQPTEFRDIIALVALYRPGPMDYIPTYARRKHGREEVPYPDERLREILHETYGICVYQEQSMQIAKNLAGFTPGEADTLRKAIGKKNLEMMNSLEPAYIEGCRKNGVPREVGKALWADNIKAADYSFNKSHAACYGYIAYVTAFLKANYPNQYMCALMTSVMSTKDKVPFYMYEARRMGLTVVAPDVNRSVEEFSVVPREADGVAVLQADGKPEYDIVFGLTAVKRVGSGVVADIHADRDKRGPFRSIFDLMRRLPHLNKTVLEALVLSGALDSTGASRKSMHESIEGFQTLLKKEVREKEKQRQALLLEAWDGYGQEVVEQQGLFGDATPVKRKRVVVDPRPKSMMVAISALMARDDDISAEAALAAAAEALEKIDRRDARRQLKVDVESGDVQLAEAAEQAGIADEEGGGFDPKAVQAALLEERVAAGAASRAAEVAGTRERLLAAVEQTRRALAEDVDPLAEAMAVETEPVLSADDWSTLERLNREREVVGLYASGHPLSPDREKWRRYVSHGLGHITAEQEGETVRLVGAVTAINREIPIRSGTMKIVTLEDLTGAREITFFPDALEGGASELVAVGNIVIVKARVTEDTFSKQKSAEEEDVGDAEPGEKAMKLTAGSVFSWDADQLPEPEPDPVSIVVPASHWNPVDIERLRDVFRAHAGAQPVRLTVVGNDKGYRSGFSVEATAAFIVDVKAWIASEAQGTSPARGA